MRALLVQADAAPGDPAANARSAAAIVLAHPDVDLVAFPELFLNGYDLRTVRNEALDPAGGELEVARTAAREAGTAIVIGFAERRGGQVANAAACIADNGEIDTIYRKTHLFGAEAEVFEPGDELVVAQIAGLRIGVLTCFDAEFPEPARALARAGADVLLTVAANMEPFLDDHRIATQARALDNRRWHLYVNRCGEDAGTRFVGGTRAIRPSGAIEAECPPGPGTLEVDVDISEVADDRLDYLKHVREDLNVTTSTHAIRGGTL